MKHFVLALGFLVAFCVSAHADGLMPGPGIVFGSTNPATIYQSDTSGNLLYDGDFISVSAAHGVILSATEPLNSTIKMQCGGVNVFSASPTYTKIESDNVVTSSWCAIGGGLVVNSDNDGVSHDFSVRNNFGSDTFYVDVSESTVGINIDLPEYPLDVSGTAMFRGKIIESATGTHSVSVGFANIAVQGGMGGGAWNEGMVFDTTTTLTPTVFCVPLPIKQFGSDVVVDSITTQISADDVASITLCEIGRYDPDSVTYVQCYAISGAVTIPSGTNTIEFPMPVVDGFVAGQSIGLSVGIGLGSATTITISGFTINYHLE